MSLNKLEYDDFFEAPLPEKQADIILKWIVRAILIIIVLIIIF